MKKFETEHSTEVAEEDTEEAETAIMEDKNATTCGLFGFRPTWLQKFLSRKTYLLVFLLLATSQAMIFSYLTVVLSTIEKQFGLQSKEAAWIYSGNEISQIAFIFFLPFVGRVRKKPLAMGVMSIMSAIGMFIIALPHFTGRGKSFTKGKDYEPDDYPG